MTCEICGAETDDLRAHLAEKHPHMLAHFDAMNPNEIVPTTTGEANEAADPQSAQPADSDGEVRPASGLAEDAK